MTNSQKYKTAEEREKAFQRWCKNNRNQISGPICKIDMANCFICQFAWLDLEAEEEEILPCPYCGGECTVDGASTNEHHDDGTWFVSCNNENCYYSSGLTKGKDAAIANHNRVARGAMKSDKLN